MTHPPAGPHTPTPPPGPKQPIPALDPNTDAGRAASEALSQALAEIQLAVWQRKTSADRPGAGPASSTSAGPARTAA
ncbi:MAG: hypothetical protein WA890_23070 [Micromonospora sp.]